MNRHPLHCPSSLERVPMSKALMRRRSLLKQLGAASFLATPVFRASLAEAQAAPLRFIVITFPGGCRDQSNFSFGRYLSPLAPYKSDILLFENVRNACVPEGWGHGGEQTILTGNGVGVSEDVPATQFPSNFVSVDQMVAQAIGAKTRFGSLQFAIQTDQPPKGDDPPVRSRIAFSNGVPVAPVQDPKIMFTRLFGSGKPMPPPPAPGTPSAPVDMQELAKIQAAALQRKSVLDLLKDQVSTIKGVVGTQEKQRLDEHLNALRELEKSLPVIPGSDGTTVPVPGDGGPEPVAGSGCKAPAPFDKALTDVPAVGAAMNELVYQAITCDLTRVATLQWLNTGTDMAFPWAGVSKSHHDCQHHPDANFDKMQTWLMSQVAVLIKRLKDTPEGNGSMLDNSLVFLTSEMGDAAAHSTKFVPALLAGKAGGAVRPGRTINAANGTHNNLLLSIANAMGLKLTTIGEAKYCTGAYNVG